MRSDFESQENDDKYFYKELQVLNEVEESSDLTQRELSEKIGVSLGLTNVLLRNLIKKGYVRSQQASWKRRAYLLTPDGISRKFKLTVNYVRRFVNHYQNVRAILRKQLEPLDLDEESRVAILGVGELAELIYLCLKELDIKEIDVYSSDHTIMHMRQFLGMPVRNIASLDPSEYSKVLLAEMNQDPEDLIHRMFKRNENSNLVSFLDEQPRG